MSNTRFWSKWIKVALFAAVCTAGSAACSDDDYKVLPGGDAMPRPDGTLPDAAPPDALVLPDRVDDPDGPEITILKPVSGQIVTGNQMTVEARIRKTISSVDPNSVFAYVTEATQHPLSRQPGGDDTYKGIVDISSIGNGPAVVVVTASDLQGRTSSAEMVFERDLGPEILFFSPQDGDRYVSSAPLNIEVRDEDGVEVDSVTAFVGDKKLDLVEEDRDNENNPPLWINYGFEIVFDDFSPPLRGSQMINVDARNTNNTKSSASVTFVIDREGPQITILTPEPGQLVGGIMNIEVSVSDPAGVLASSVVAVLGGDNISKTIVLHPAGSYYVGAFDTRIFPSNFIFPSISVRAADTLGNENEVGYLLALDNQPPVLSLDPPENFRMAVKNSVQQWECSWEFDPVGSDAANSGETVPQVFWLRARIEDKGNHAPGLVQHRLALVDYSSVKLYILQDTANHPLVIDDNGDGYCNEMNPLLIPTTSPTESDEVLVLNMSPISPAGKADFTFEPDADLPDACDLTGFESEKPNDLCSVTTMTTAIHYTSDSQEPAIYSLPPVSSGDSMFCSGNQFDALANNIEDGWTCAAVRAVDRLGNVGISEPLPICIDSQWDPLTEPVSLFCNAIADSMPDCTGTQNPDTLEVTMDPCTFSSKQLFPEREVRRRD